jgi:predicted secreted Zn-dependent protease
LLGYGSAVGRVHEQASARGSDLAPSVDRGASTWSHGFGVALNSATIGPLLAGSDGATRQRLIASLQAQHGNAAVQRLLAGPGLAVQRWAVTLPRSTTDCAVVVNWMNANSPYRATSGWARTNARFSWGGDPVYSTADGATTATVSSPTVTKTVSVDMPTWAPTDAAMSAAWSAMVAELRAHEALHEGIANTWEGTLRTNLTGLTVTVPNRNIASFRSAVQTEWNGWLAQHQADQTAIDPFSALLDCSGGSPNSGGSGGGGGGGNVDLTGLDGEADLGGL